MVSGGVCAATYWRCALLAAGLGLLMYLACHHASLPPVAVCSLCCHLRAPSPQFCLCLRGHLCTDYSCRTSLACRLRVGLCSPIVPSPASRPSTCILIAIDLNPNPTNHLQPSQSTPPPTPGASTVPTCGHHPYQDNQDCGIVISANIGQPLLGLPLLRSTRFGTCHSCVAGSHLLPGLSLVSANREQEGANILP